MKTLFRGGFTAAAAALCATAVHAGPLVITPTTVAIAPDRRSAVVEVENTGDDPVDLQFRAYDWRQESGQDRLTPTDALVVSPAIATLPPHGKQVFRVLQFDGRPVAGERSYRLRLNQLPRPEQKGVSILLEFSIPVFQGISDAKPRLAWSQGPGGVTVTNSGNRRIRLRDLALRLPGGTAAALAGSGSAYLLSGATRTFALATPVERSIASRLVGLGDTGPIDEPATALAAR